MASGARVALVTGFVLMVVASAWAPLQPELVGGGACQHAPCGTLEDPDRWRQAWWLWSVGALTSVVAAAWALAPRRPHRRGVGLLLVSAVAGVVPTVVLAWVLSVLTSVQGVATGAVLVPLAVVAVVGAWTRGRAAV